MNTPDADESTRAAAATLMETIPSVATSARHLVDALHRESLDGESSDAGMRYATRALRAAIDGNGERAIRQIILHAREYLESDKAAEARLNMPEGIEVDEGVWFLTAVNGAVEMLLMAMLILDADESAARPGGAA